MKILWRLRKRILFNNKSGIIKEYPKRKEKKMRAIKIEKKNMAKIEGAIKEGKEKVRQDW